MPTIDTTLIGNNIQFTDRDPDYRRETRGQYPHSEYATWRSMFDGSYLDEETEDSPDPETGEPIYRWPVRYNLFKAYSLTHAGMLWGRGETGREASNLFDLTIRPELPGMDIRNLTSAAPAFEDMLDHWWGFNSSILRSSGARQQWAGGCIIKISWNPWHPDATYGVIAEIIEPEYFFPVPDPLNSSTLLAAKIKFRVDADIAILKYGLTAEQAKKASEGEDKIVVEEYWDRQRYYIRLGKGKNQVTARLPTRSGGPGPKQDGPNPWVHPVTQMGIIPIVYVPRLLTSQFWGDSLVGELEGLAREVNKTLADIGDAVTGATHYRGVIADDNQPRRGAKQSRYINMPTDGLLNMGKTPPGGQQGRYWDVSPPEVPTQTPMFLDGMLGMAEHAAQLTPAARGTSSSTNSGFALAMEMLPTTNLIDWARSHWTTAIAGRSGINVILGTIWHNQYKVRGIRHLGIVPAMNTPNVLRCEQVLSYRPVVPKDRVAVITEVTQLVVNKVIGPREALRRLGDVEDIESALTDLWAFLIWMATVDASVAGHSLKWSGDAKTEDDQPPMPKPELTGETAQPKTKQPAKQPEGQKKSS